ncbi:hypothetical protein C7448_102446 [Tenacibaculum gallaicum]|uniref:Glutathionylspermidine synthase n=1 Tax=Tenacibaculum gallaicum TaxID=561505 RepID=A0A3E0I837_9FLAO|nr:hypothetical protein [Tenacibaculum gallaicum]REH54913.1 hypothetical protein C7448_102446 [Tenacibaculum gallaicum]
MNNTILREKYNSFIKSGVRKENTIKVNNDLVPEIFHNYDVPISSWPVLLDKNQIEGLNKLCKELPKLLQKIPYLYFKSDTKKISEFYFEGNEMLAQFALMSLAKDIEISSRLDIIQTQEGFKVLEINMGSSIGGMEFQNFDELIRSLHPIMQKKNNDKDFVIKKTQSIYINFIIKQSLKFINSKNSDINIFLVGYGKSTEEDNEVQQYFQRLLNEELKYRELKGKVFIGKIEELNLVKNNLFYKDKHIDSVLILNYASLGNSPNLFRAFLTNRVYFPDHLGTTLLGDKRNLSILRILAQKKSFSEEINLLILKCIPWTELLKDENVMYNQKEVSFINLLKENKNLFVIKVANELQGSNVFVGKFMEQNDWNNTILEAIESKNYLVQEFCDSRTVFAPNEDDKWVPNRLILGAYGFGDIYGGVCARLSQINKKETGVVNVASGAIGGLVYEYN